MSISDRVFNGSAGTVGDPISLGTAWSYREFATGSLAGYNYNDNISTPVNERKTLADTLQKAIWSLEGEESIIYDAANSFMFAVVDMFGSADAAKADADGAYGVGVLNMYNLEARLRINWCLCFPFRNRHLCSCLGFL